MWCCLQLNWQELLREDEHRGSESKRIHPERGCNVSKVLAADGGQRRLAMERSGITATIDL